MAIRSTLGLAAVLLAMTLLGGPAAAGKADDSLTVPIAVPLASADPYYAPGAEIQWVARAVFDTLIELDPRTGTLRPGLATSWKWIDPRTLELELRQGVTFHDGSRFDADDVVYTFTFLSHFKEHQLPLPGRFSWFAGAKKLGPYRVRLFLRRSYPPALQQLAINLPMLPAEYHRKLGSPKDFGRRPIGTGPYKAVAGDDGRLTLVRFGDYWQRAQAGGRIGRIVLFTVKDQAAQVAALLDGRADFVGGVTPDQAREVADKPGYAVTTGDSLGYAYLALNAADRDGAKRATARPEVRRAIAHALDRRALAQRFGGIAVEARRSAFCHPAQIGCPTEAPGPAYDTAEARKLLSAVRLTDDVDLTIDSFGPYKRLAEAVSDNLFQVTINARAEHLTLAAFNRKRAKGTLDAVVAEWGGGGLLDVSATAATFFEGIGNDMSGDGSLALLMKSAYGETDAERRAALYAEGFRKAAAEAYVIPLFRIVPRYAHRRGLTFEAGYLLGLPPLQGFAWQ
ncbi:MAG: ABC transporter substrate-binding protein [Candidatus Eiseniibacteriota bacterium]